MFNLGGGLAGMNRSVKQILAMKRQLRRFILAAVAVSLFSSVSSVQNGTRVAAQSAATQQSVATRGELPNFHQVNERLYRGAQPKSGGIERLAALGIKTIVNLRGDDERTLEEEAEARAAGLRYFHVPMRWYGRPSDAQVKRVLAIINSPENQPVFLHCRRGADRTGTIIAVYRIRHDGWTSARAQQEANRYGMRRWRLGMRDYIQDYGKSYMRDGDERPASSAF